MKRFLFFIGVIFIFSCKSTPKVEVEDNNRNHQNEVKISENEVVNENQPVEKNDSLSEHSNVSKDTLKKDSLLTEKKDKLEKEKKKEEKKPEPEIKEPDFPDLPETDVYNPKEDPAPNEFVLVDKEAKPKNLEEVIEDIKFDAKLYGVKGRAVVGVLVSTHGNYLKHYFFGVTNKKLEYIVADKIQKLKFRPATLNGEPVKMWYKTTIEIN